MNRGELGFYRDLLGDIKTRVRAAQHRAARAANAEMLFLYWDIGRMIANRQAPNPSASLFVGAPEAMEIT